MVVVVVFGDGDWGEGSPAAGGLGAWNVTSLWMVVFTIVKDSMTVLKKNDI